MLNKKTHDYLHKIISLILSSRVSLLCYGDFLQYPKSFFSTNSATPFYLYINVKKPLEHRFFDISFHDNRTRNLLNHTLQDVGEKQVDKNQVSKLLVVSSHHTKRQDVDNTNQSPYHLNTWQQQSHFFPYLCKILSRTFLPLLPAIGNITDYFNIFGGFN